MRVWDIVCKVMELESWVSGVTKTRPVGRITGGVGAQRRIEFDDGSVVSEIITGWKDQSYFSYIMLDGLPLCAYHATIALKPRPGGITRVVWHSYFVAKATTQPGFAQVRGAMNRLYKTSLARLKRIVEDT